jgi:MFS family permease
MVPGGTLAPLAEREFRLLWLGRVSSAVGDVLVPVALTFAVLGLHDSATWLGVVLASFMVSRVAFSLVGGVFADRLSRRTVMLACDAVRFVVESFTAAMLFAHLMTVPLFVVTAAVFGAASAFFWPASSALVPQTVSPENLQAANGLLGMSQNALNVFGPVVSGTLIVATGTTAWVFALDAFTFVFSIFFIAKLRVPGRRSDVHSHFARDLRDGFREVARRSWVSSALVGFSITNFCLASFLVLGPKIVNDDFHGARDWGFVAGAGALGATLGGLLSLRLRPQRPLMAGFSASLLIAAPIAALARPLPIALIAVAFGLAMASIAFCNTLWETALQRRIPDGLLARVRSYDLLVSFVCMPVGYLAFGPLAAAVGASDTLIAAACVMVVTNLVVTVRVRTFADGPIRVGIAPAETQTSS